MLKGYLAMQSKSGDAEIVKNSKDIFEFIRYFAYFLEVILFFVIQRCPATLFFSLTGTQPIYLVPIALSISILEKKSIGLLYSLMQGIIIDVDFTYKLGFYTIMLPIFSIILNSCLKKRLQMNSFVSIFLIYIFILLTSLLEPLFLSIFTEIHFGAFEYFNFYLKRSVFTLIVAPLFYLFSRAISLFLKKEVIT